MDLKDTDKDLLLDYAFFWPEEEFKDLKLRPLSLMSYKFLQLVGSPFLDDSVELSEVEETQQVALYLWLHSVPIGEVCHALWEGTWRHHVDAQEEPLPEVVEMFRPIRVRMIALLHACRVEIRPRPALPNDDTPKDVIGPTDLAFRITALMRGTNLTRHQIKWEVWLFELMQYYHAEARWQGMWTVCPGREVRAEDFMDTVPDWMKPRDPEEPPPEFDSDSFADGQ